MHAALDELETWPLSNRQITLSNAFYRLMEPDWHQYSELSQEGGGLSQEDMVKLYNRMTEQVLIFLPGAKFSIECAAYR